MSRPRLSVPKKYTASPPAAKDGGSSVESRSCSSGSCGATAGAKSAVKSTRLTITPPTMPRASRRGRARRSSGGATSTMLQPRIEPGDQHVDQQVGGDEDDREGDHQPLDEWQVAVDQCIDRHFGGPLIGGDALDQPRTAAGEGELHRRQ